MSAKLVHLTVTAGPYYLKEIVKDYPTHRVSWKMLTISLLSPPGPRRRISNPVLDTPTKWAWLGESGYGEAAFGDPPSGFSSVLAADATPHRPAFEKTALSSMVLDSPHCPTPPWEGCTPPAKRSWLHMESVLPPIASQSPGATPQVIWGCLTQSPFPGEQALVADPSLAERHLRLYLALVSASGHPGTPRPTSTSDSTTPPRATTPPPPPGLGVGFFSWIKELSHPDMTEGPSGRGWGRMGDDARRTYHLTTGRNDPGMLRICGFSYATTEGVVSLEYEDEGEALSAGMEMIEKARYTANVTVESVTPFKLFTLMRATFCAAILPDWLIFPPGRCWLAGLSRFTPRGEPDPLTWVMRTGVACGEKTCSRMIPEPGAAWLRETGNPGISARAMVSAITRSPFFQMGMDRAPDLIARSSTPDSNP